jgi:pimeloyl-ACP methyl ester carboxylesterase
VTRSDAKVTRFEASPAAGLTLRGEADGEGAPIVLLHGLTATRRYVVQGSRLLARSGYRVVGYDARGHGESDPAPERSAYGYPDLVEDLARVLDELGLERPVLAGSSMGAVTAMALTLANPDRVSALVQVTPAHDGRPSDDPAWERMAEALDRGDVEAFVERSGASELPERFRDVARTATRQRIEHHRHLSAVADALRTVPRSVAFDGLDALESLGLPVLVVGSRDEADPGHPLAIAEEYARRLPAGRLVVEDEGRPPLAWQGSQLSRAIAEFLAEAGVR